MIVNKLTQSYVHGASAIPLIGSTIGEYFDKAVVRWPETEALVVRHQGVRWTYRDLQRHVDAFAAGLLALGLGPGDRVGIWSPNAEWVVTIRHGQGGIILVNINPAYRLAELEYVLNKVGCKGLITAMTFKTSDYVGMLRHLAPELDTCRPGALHAARLPALQTVICLADAHCPACCALRMYPPWRARPSSNAWRNWRRRCSSMSRSTFSSPVVPRVPPRGHTDPPQHSEQWLLRW